VAAVEHAVSILVPLNLVIIWVIHLSSNGQYLSSGDCVENNREDYQNCSMLCCE